ncbi:MAG: DUF4156 domain-containing protein [Prevotellaceae bacterium]|jgi:hypothetical protein|nr:DUF4156 domain-containing protein [Prevotellaceae bacterium]
MKKSMIIIILLVSSIITLLLMMQSCGTVKRVSVLNYSTPLSADTEVEIYSSTQQIPSNLLFLGTVSIGDGGFTTKCSYSEVINDLKQQSLAVGGNVLVITMHKEPSFASTCHRIKADVYKKKN